MVATTLRRGQLAIIQVDSDDADDPHIGGTQNMNRDTISFVLLAPVGSGTQIFFTDRTWTASGTTLNSGSFSNSGADGTYTWTAATDLPAGTVIVITQAELTAAGISLADTGEVIYAYQGSANVPTGFLFAIEYGDGNDTFNNIAGLTNTGLSVGDGAVAIAEDNVSYGERIHNQQTAVLFQNLSDHTNWHTNENSPQNDHIEGTNLQVAPDHQLWIAGISGGHGIISVSGDATQNGGTAGYNVQTHFQNTANDGNALTFTQRFWSPTHILFDTVAGKFFIVDSSGTFDRVLQGNISDLLNNPGVAPTMTILWSDKPATSDGDGVTSIQLDKASGHVYFTADNKLHRVDYDTADQTGIILADLLNDPDTGNKNFANELVLDLANGRAFIVSTESFSDFVEVAPGTPGAFESPPGSGDWFIVGTVMHQNSIHLVENISSSDTNATGNTITQLNFTEAFDDDDNAFGDQLNEFDNLKGKITDIELNTSTGEIWFTTVQLNSGSDGSVGGIYKATLSGTTLTVTQIYVEGNGTNQNFFHIHIDEETGYYYVTSIENGQSGNHAVYRGLLSSAPGTAPTFYATVGNINELSPRDLTVESAPTLTGSGNGGLGVTEASSAPNSGETARVTLYGALTASDIDTTGGDELAGALVRISSGFTFEASSTAAGHTGTVDFLRINGTISGTISGSGITYSYNSATGVMTLSGPATVAEYAAALQLVQFSTSGDNVTNDGNATSRTISASVFDGLLYSDEVNVTVAVTGINDAPVNTVGGAMSFTEDTTGTAGNPTPPPAPVNAITGISIADADADATTENFTVTLTVSNGILTIRTDVTGGLVSGDVTGNGTATLVLTGTQTEINNTLAAVNNSAQPNGLVYTPNANFNGADTLTIVTNDQGNNGNDPGVTGTGTTEQDSDQQTLNVADVNDAPTVGGDGDEVSPTIFEDTPFTDSTAPSVATLFGGQFADALDIQFVAGTNETGSTGDTFAGIAIVANGSSGATGQWQYWNGSAWVDIGAASADAAKTLTAATLIRFNPAQDFNGAAPTLTAHLIETGGPAIVNGSTVDLNPAPPTTGAGSVYSADTVVLSQDITAVNDAPTSTNLAGDSVTWTEGDGAVLLDAGGNATFTDVDSPFFDTGSFTVAITGGFVSGEDSLGIDTSGNVTLSAGLAVGSNVSVGGSPVGQISAVSDDSITIVLNANADAPDIDQLARAFNYSNSGGDAPTDGDRTISWTFVDGDGVANGGQDTLSLTSTVDVDPVNDAPQGDDKTVAIDEDAPYTFAAADFGFTDPAEGHALSAVEITTLPALGTLTLDGNAVTAGQAIDAADIGLLVYTPAANDSGTGYASFTFKVIDDGGTLDGGVDKDPNADTITFDVNPINDAPTHVAPATASFDEDGSVTFSAGNGNAITVADVDAGAADLTTTLSIADGTLTLNAAALAALTSVTGDGTNDVTLVGTAAEIEAALDGLVYAPPANANGARTLTVTTNDGGATGDDPGLTGGVADEQGSIEVAITINSVNDAPTGTDNEVTTSEDDAYVFTAADFGFDDVDGNNLAGVLIATLPGQGTLLLSGSAVAQFDEISVADIDAGNLTFEPAADEFGDDYATFTFQVRDDGGVANGGADSDPTERTMTIDVTADNFAPELDLNGVDTGIDTIVAYTEQAAPVELAPDAVVTDADGTDIESATLTISGGFQANLDFLTINGATSGNAGPGDAIAFSYDSSTGVLSLTGSATLADYQAVLRQAGFESTSDAPGATRTISWTVNDGIADSTAATTTVNITAVDDVPAGTSSTVAIDEDEVVTLAAADFGFADPDGQNFAGVRFEGAPTGGALFYDSDGAGGADPVEITTFPTDVTAADIAAGNLTFVPTANLNGTGAASFDFKVLDDGATDNVDPSANTLTFDIAAVNDAPEGTNATIAIDEDASHLFAATDFGFSDPVEGDGFAGVVITTLPAAGALYLNGVEVTVAGTFVSATDIGNDLLTFEPAANGNGTGYASFTFQVRDDGGTADGGVDTDPNADTITIDVNAINDAPVPDLNGGGGGVDSVAAYTENAGTVLLAPDGLLADVDDAEIEGATVSITGGFIADQDFLTVNGAVGGTVGAIAFDYDTTTGVLTLTGAASPADYQAVMRQVGFNSISDDPGASRTIDWSFDDGDDQGTAQTTINVTEVNDAPVAQDDDVATDEDAALNGDVFADNGNGADSDPDDPLEVSEVNGSAANVGTQITLASGALLTLNADGTFSYDPNGQFGYLITPAVAVATGAGNDTLTNAFTYELVNGSGATVTVTVTGVASADDELRGDSGDNTITDTVGIDFFRLDQGGDDTASGQSGNDVFVFGAEFTELDNVDGGDGFDELRLEGDYWSVPLVLGPTTLLNVELITLGTGFSYDIIADGATVAGGALLTVDGSALSPLEELWFDGSAESDGRFVLIGGGCNDLLIGGAGDDVLIGGAGFNDLDGGAGSDTADYSAAPGPVFAGLAARFADNGHGDFDSLLRIENLIGSAFDDVLNGSNAANRLDGGAGADRMKGGAGDDTYIVDDAGDVAVENSTADGVDTVRSSVGFSLQGQFLENLVLTGSAAIDGTGNDFANRILGNNAANVLNGGAGADEMKGGGGDDTYFVDDAGDVVVENSLAEGIDTVRSSVGFSLQGQFIENLVLTGSAAINGTGNALANRILGNDAANVLNGGGGADFMKGGGGDDIYIVDNIGDVVRENSAAEGIDLVRSSVSFTLGANLEHLTLAGTDAIDGTGNGLANTIVGNRADNVLDGRGGDDILNGGTGDDDLHGGLGNDTLEGGSGFDAFHFDTALGASNVDTILDFNRGVDTIILENAVFTGLAAGALSADALTVGTEATTADHRIIYDPTTGALLFDADGSGAGAAVQFATLDNLPATLSTSDFAVI